MSLSDGFDLIYRNECTGKFHRSRTNCSHQTRMSVHTAEEGYTPRYTQVNYLRLIYTVGLRTQHMTIVHARPERRFRAICLP